MQKEKYADLIWDYDEVAHKKFIENLAPIVLFTYNRLEHTRKTVAALQQNVYAENSELYIYSDGPKNEAVKGSVEAVRTFLHTVDGFKQVHIIERDKNWGLAENIIDGVTSIVNKYGRIIVLEDDIVTSKYFLKYMNDALEVYKKQPKVMNISANCWMPDSDKKSLPETFFLLWNACWGWGTWKDRWIFFKRNPEELIKNRQNIDINRFNFNGSMDIWEQIMRNYNKMLYTWAVFWDAAIFMRGGLVLYSNHDLCKNVGMDGSGENCGITHVYDREIEWNKEVSQFSLNFKVNEEAEKIVVNFFRRAVKKRSLINRVSKVFCDEGFTGAVKRVINKL